MVQVKGVSGSVKEVGIILVMLIALVLLIPYILKYFIKGVASNASDLISDAAESIQPALDKKALEMMPRGKVTIAIQPELSPALFPNTDVGANNYGVIPTAPQSQPFISYLRGTGEPGTGYMLSPEQEAAFLDPVGDAQFEERRREGLKAQQVEKSWWQVW